MTMAIFRDDGIEQYEVVIARAESAADLPSNQSEASIVPLIDAKLRKPRTTSALNREWLMGLMERSAKNSAATMLVGRAGSGKTAVASDFVGRRADHAWYSIDSSDADWAAFQRYFRAAVVRSNEAGSRSKNGAKDIIFSPSPMELFADITAALELRSKPWPSILVLDGIHHLYDCHWFDEFFTVLIASLPHSSHALIISRSKPPTPIWRMRSKQVLNVIDEKLLAFSLAEAEELFARRGLGREIAVKVHTETFGRASEMIGHLEAAVVNH